MSHIQAQIQDLRSNFTPAQERIAEYLLDHTLEAALLTATELAQRMDVDPATVVRFAQKLGYQGYLELKADLSRMVRGEDQHEIPKPAGRLGEALETAHQMLASNFDHLWQRLESGDLIQLTELLGTPCRLLLLTDDSCANVGTWLAGELRAQGFTINHPAGDPEALGATMLALEDTDRALILEGPQPSPTLGRLSLELSRKEIRTLGIYYSAASQVAKGADAALLLPTQLDADLLPRLMQQLLNTVLHALHFLQASDNVDRLDHAGDMKNTGTREA